MINRQLCIVCLTVGLATCLVPSRTSSSTRPILKEIPMESRSGITVSELLTQVVTSTAVVERFHFRLVAEIRFADASKRTVSTEGDYVGPNNLYAKSTSLGVVQSEILIRSG